MKRIVVLCDGTWNSPDMKDTTHLVDLALALKKEDAQKVAYFSGVGVNDDQQFEGWLGRNVNKVLGGATGHGLGSKVQSAYKFIAETYEDGDEIYLFGFSRGAFTARSVAGMIRKCGIVDDTTPQAIRKAFRLYRKAGPQNHPDRPHIQKARAEMSPRFATSAADQAARSGFVPLVNIAYLGVWDTVGARGIPTQLFGVVAKAWNQQYEFHDMELSSLVKAARHAVATDERRVFFEPTLWTNLDTLNAAAGVTNEARPYQQAWFVGDHAIIGGSAGCDPLSRYTLAWIVEGAPRLTFRDTKTWSLDQANALFDTDRLTGDPGSIYQIASNLLAWRRGPDADGDIHETTRVRLKQRGDYRPESLKRFFGALT